MNALEFYLLYYLKYDLNFLGPKDAANPSLLTMVQSGVPFYPIPPPSQQTLKTQGGLDLGPTLSQSPENSAKHEWWHGMWENS